MEIVFNQIENTLKFSHNGRNIEFDNFEAMSPINPNYESFEIDINLDYENWEGWAWNFTDIFGRGKFVMNGGIKQTIIAKENNVEKINTFLYNDIQMLIGFEVINSEREAKMNLELNFYNLQSINYN